MITNNHNSADVSEPAFSDDESDTSIPKIKIEEDDDDIPIGKLGNSFFSSSFLNFDRPDEF